MNYDRIDALPGYGNIYQGGRVDSQINEPPFEETLIVTMDKGEIDDSFVDHKTVQANLYVGIEDNPDACLPDSVLLSLADAVAAWLKDGKSAYLHCEAGVSRASYIDCAVHCRILGCTFEEALARIRAERPVADPNSGFAAQLQRLFG